MNCPTCKSEFEPKRKATKQRFCSEPCYMNWFNESRRKPQTERICKQCGKAFVSTNSGQNGRKFCSRKCCQKVYDKIVYENAKANGKLKERANLKYKTDIRYRLRLVVGGAVKCALKRRGLLKTGSTWQYLPYSPLELVKHLERQFTADNGFTWDNYGSVWHVDHVVPQSWFVFSKMDDEEFKKCWALSNLQPMKKFDNQSKHNRFVGHFDNSGQIVFA